MIDLRSSDPVFVVVFVCIFSSSCLCFVLYRKLNVSFWGEYLTTGLFVSRVNLNNIDLVNYVKTILFDKT